MRLENLEVVTTSTGSRGQNKKLRRRQNRQAIKDPEILQQICPEQPTPNRIHIKMYETISIFQIAQAINMFSPATLNRL